MSPAAAADGGLGVLASCARPSPADEQSAATPANNRLRMLTPVIVVAIPKAKALFFPHHLKGACDQQQPSTEVSRPRVPLCNRLRSRPSGRLCVEEFRAMWADPTPVRWSDSDVSSGARLRLGAIPIATRAPVC